MFFPEFDRLRDLEGLRHDQEGVNVDQLVKDNPRIGERLAHGSDDVRSRVEEAKRANVEKMRQLQKIQMMNQDAAFKDGDWAKRLEAVRDKLPPNFNMQDVANRVKEVLCVYMQNMRLWVEWLY